MRKRVVLLAAVAMFFVSISAVWAADNIIETVAKGCEKELTSYCKDVTPGEGPFMMRQLSLRDSLPHSVMWQMNAMRTWRDFVLTLPLVKVAS
jgi:hypothetical protein